MPNLHHPPVEPIGVRAERRNLSVLFCDIVGSSALSARLDPEDLCEILRAYQAACGDAISQYDGHIARYMGDGVLAYFGFPAAHEDDVERAVNAALRMIASISTLSLPRTPSLEIRIAIATGLVVVGDLIGEGPNREFALIGETPNLAACLQQYAKPNQILVSEKTRRLLGRRFEFADLGAYPAKGHEQPVRVWRVLRPSSIQSRFEARQSSQLTPFVGRELELASLNAHFVGANCGTGRLVTIVGEPGIGKSRLIKTFRSRLAGEAFRTLLFQCSSYHTTSPWYPVIRHVEDAAGIAHVASPARKLKKLEAWIHQHVQEGLEQIAPLMAELLSIPVGDRYPGLELSAHQRKARTLAALRDLIRAQCQRQPAILVFEDAHWIDPTSWELLEILAHGIENARMLIIVSSRHDFPVPWMNHPQMSSMVLNRLERGDVSCMIEALADGCVLSEAAVEQIVIKTDGVPLFIEEVTKSVLEDCALRKAVMAGEAPRTPAVPETLHDFLMARLDQLGPTKIIAQTAAAIGREFSRDLLIAVASMTEDELSEALDRLLASGLVFRCGPAAAESYTFKHALVQDTAYASLLRDERRDLHMRIAEALCTKFADVAGSAPELIAHHYTQARQTTLAINYWLKAGRQASKRTAFVEAIVHFQMALKLLGELPGGLQRDTLELELQQSLASAFIAAKGFGAAETMQAFSRALELCEKLADSSQIFAVLNGIAGVHLMRGEFEQSRNAAEDLLARAQLTNDPTALLMGHRIFGMSLFMIGDLNGAQKELHSALELYDPPRHAPLAVVFAHDFKATAQAYLGLLSVVQGDVEGGLKQGHEALAYAEHLRHPHSICYALTFLTAAYLVAGMPTTAYPFAERTAVLSGEYGFPQWRAAGHLLRGWVRIDLGETDSGLADIRTCMGWMEATSTYVWMYFARFHLARALAQKGQVDEATSLVEQILGKVGATPGWYESEVHRLMGDLLNVAGRPSSVSEACYEAAIAVAVRQGARLWQLRATNALCALWRLHGRTSDLQRRLIPLYASFKGSPVLSDLLQSEALLTDSALY